MTLTLLGRIPSKKNSKRWLKRGGKLFLVPSEAYESWHDLQMLALKRLTPDEPLKHVAVSLTFYPPDRLRGDLSNKTESVMDLLVDAGILEDDNWFAVGNVHMRLGNVDPKRPRVEIEISN